MACYIINYDLRKVKNYDDLINAIKSYDKWAKVLKSCWAVGTTKTAVEIRDHLQTHMDEDDGLFVVKSGAEAAWRRVECKNEWLKDNL